MGWQCPWKCFPYIQVSDVLCYKAIPINYITYLRFLEMLSKHLTLIVNHYSLCVMTFCYTLLTTPKITQLTDWLCSLLKNNYQDIICKCASWIWFAWSIWWWLVDWFSFYICCVSWFMASFHVYSFFVSESLGLVFIFLPAVFQTRLSDFHFYVCFVSCLIDWFLCQFHLCLMLIWLILIFIPNVSQGWLSYF